MRTCCPLLKVGLFGIRDKEISALPMGNWRGLLLTEHCEYLTIQEQKPFKMEKYTQRKSPFNLCNGVWKGEAKKAI